MRITQKMLDDLCGMLNRLTGRSDTPWTRQGTSMSANVGCIHVGAVSDYYAIEEMRSTGGSTRQLFSGSARECHTYLSGRLDAIGDEHAALSLVSNLDAATPAELIQIRESLEAYAKFMGNAARRRKIAKLLAGVVGKVK
jgi:hypothetical protein